NVTTGYGTTPTGTGAVATSWAARLLSGSVLLLAVAGIWRQRVLRHRAMPPLLIAAAPLPMLVASSYGSEMIFRVLMFMLPGAAFFAAAALLPKVRTLAAEASPAPPGPAGPVRRSGVRRGLAAWVAPVVLVAGTLAFVPSYSGKDRINYFPPPEVALVRQLFDEAPEGSLVVAANRNYPLAYASYGEIDHYWFLDDERSHVDRIVADPAGTLAEDMAGVDGPGRAYLLFSQGQLANSTMNGQLTEAQLTGIEQSVAASPRFRRVAGNGAGTVYELRADGGTGRCLRRTSWSGCCRRSAAGWHWPRWRCRAVRRCGARPSSRSWRRGRARPWSAPVARRCARGPRRGRSTGATRASPTTPTCWNGCCWWCSAASAR